MGLSTKQVSGDELEWAQSLLPELPKPQPPARRQQPQAGEQLACPRCGSTNTKFCYYNNYNKSQPRHFCKACKRHWTKGGTLRNVPVGGGRKNKRPKTVSTTSAKTTASSRSNITRVGIQGQTLPPPLGDQKSTSEALYQALTLPPSSSQHDHSIDVTGNFNMKSLGSNNGCFLGATLPLLQNPISPFTFSSSLGSFENHRSSFQVLDVYNSFSGLSSMAEAATTSTAINASQPWQVSATSRAMELPSYWNWDDIDSLVSTELNVPWDDTEIKP